MRTTRRSHPTGPLLAAALGLLAAAPARAQPPRVAHPPTWLEGFHREADELPRAIEAIERSGGGVVTEIRFDGAGGHPGFDAAVQQGRHVAFVRLERGRSRYTALPRARQARWMPIWRAREQVTASMRARVSLTEAVREAETDAGNLPAVAASVATRADDPLRYAPAYNVLLLTPEDAVQRVAVDARTGLSVANLGALATWPHPLP